MWTGRFFIGACIAAFLLLSAFRFASGTTDIERLPVGSEIPEPDVEMRGVDGEMHALGSVTEKSGLLVLFTGSNCSWVNAWEDRYNEIATLASEHHIGVIALNSNAARRKGGNGLADMKERAEEEDYRFPYVVDDRAAMANAFGATKTPEVFLFDGERRLVYRGAIDDNPRNASAVEKSFLKDAIRALVMDQAIDTQSTKSVGCEIKRPER
ncbi:thioredoxin family protein [Longibacter salinarum]|uniref:Thioredoxin family protein n=1 Tax=Longibacter salinarum TaxID=1850348 RepID=A0A2A8CV38_9BACT|nr:thioredoxin family protein [Longibacter salinarum]PEN12575.1 thioredoxin family protein [Longibacter salinarum]